MEENYIEHMLVRDIQTKKPFKDFFTINRMLLDSIKEDIKENGFNNWSGVHLWGDVCVDGHTRLTAATELDLETIPVWKHEFESEDDALDFTIVQQGNRRNLTDPEIQKCVEVNDNRQKRGGNRNPEGKNQQKEVKAQSCALTKDTPKKQNKSSKPLAKKLGVSARKVEQTRTIADHADNLTKAKVEAGDMSINRAYEETQKKRRDSGELKSRRPEKSKIGHLCKRLISCSDDLTELVSGIESGSIIPTHPQDKSYFEAIRKQAPWFIILFHKLQIDVTAIHNQIKNGGINYDEKRGISTTEKGSQDNIEDCIEIKP